uniref:Uncharacterized protein n=1 Tax=Glossina brevipalpis TaxID=37001 RepID=A0A1A9WR65_9MUSC
MRGGKNQNLSYSSNDVACSLGSNILATAATNEVVSVTAHTVTFHSGEASILISGSQDGAIKCFDTWCDKPICTLYSNSECVRDGKFSPHCNNVFSAVSEGGEHILVQFIPSIGIQQIIGSLLEVEINKLRETLDNPGTILVPSLFPNVPPNLAFSSDTKKGPEIPTNNIPRVVRHNLGNNGIRLFKSEYCYKEQREEIKTDWYIHFQKKMFGWNLYYSKWLDPVKKKLTKVCPTKCEVDN